MNKRNRKLVIFIVIILIIAAAFGFWWFFIKDKYNLPIIGNQKHSSVGTTDISALKKWSANGSLIVSVDNEIQYLSLQDASATAKKIGAKSYSLATSSDGQFLYLSQDNKLKLKTNSGDKTITDENPYNPLPVISPDGKNMIVISFSNAETDYGYIIQLFSTSNNYVSDVANVQKNVTSVTWLNDSEILYAIVDENGSEIYSSKTDGKDNKKVASINGFIKNISTANEIIIVSAAQKIDSDRTSILQIEGSDAKELIADNIHKDIHLSPDGKIIAYINENNNLTAYDISSKENAESEKVGHIIGWYK